MRSVDSGMNAREWPREIKNRSHHNMPGWMKLHIFTNYFESSDNLKHLQFKQHQGVIDIPTIDELIKY